MNERIKQLAEQCYDPEYGFIIPEKFAELIVWECFLIGAKYIKSNDDVSKFERQLKETFRS